MNCPRNERSRFSIGRRIGQDGKVNFLTLLLIAGVLAAGYAGYVYVPLYLQNMDVNHRCQEALNSTWRHFSAQRTKDDVLRRIHAIDTIEKEIGGDVRTLPAIDPGDNIDVRIDQSVSPRVLSIDMSYEREVILPLLGSPHSFFFSVYCERDME